jgi:type IV secretion system protein TrbL
MKGLLIGVVAAILAAFSLDAFAQGATSSLLTQYETKQTTWLVPVINAATTLFWLLAIIQFIWAAIKLTLERQDMQGYVAGFVREIMWIGAFYALLLNGPLWIPAIVNSFINIGRQVAGVGSQELYPGNVVGRGVEIAMAFLGGAGESGFFNNPATALVLVLAALIVVVAFCLIAAQILVALVESYMVTTAGLLFLGFGGSKWTAPYVERFIGLAVSVGVKLFVLYLLVAIGYQMSNQWLADVSGVPGAAQPVATAFGIIGASLCFLMVCWQSPKLVSSMIGGSPQLSGGDFIGTTAAAATGGNGVVSAVAGAAGYAAGRGREQGGAISGSQAAAMGAVAAGVATGGVGAAVGAATTSAASSGAASSAMGAAGTGMSSAAYAAPPSAAAAAPTAAPGSAAGSFAAAPPSAGSSVATAPSAPRATNAAESSKRSDDKTTDGTNGSESSNGNSGSSGDGAPVLASADSGKPHRQALGPDGMSVGTGAAASASQSAAFAPTSAHVAARAAGVTPGDVPAHGDTQATSTPPANGEGSVNAASGNPSNSTVHDAARAGAPQADAESISGSRSPASTTPPQDTSAASGALSPPPKSATSAARAVERIPLAEREENNEARPGPGRRAIDQLSNDNAPVPPSAPKLVDPNDD